MNALRIAVGCVGSGSGRLRKRISSARRFATSGDERLDTATEGGRAAGTSGTIFIFMYVQKATCEKKSLSSRKCQPRAFLSRKALCQKLCKNGGERACLSVSYRSFFYVFAIDNSSCICSTNNFVRGEMPPTAEKKQRILDFSSAGEDDCHCQFSFPSAEINTRSA